MELYFNTINNTKKEEIREIFNDKKYDIKFLDNDVTEILSHDLIEVVKAKVAAAYCLCRVPVIVEHGGLFINYFNGFPGPLSKPMWDLMEGKICSLIPNGESRDAIAMSAIGYCDGKTRQIFSAKTEGKISIKAAGSFGFQWDPIFIPNGNKQTYGEMKTVDKMKFSQAAKAYRDLMNYLNCK